MTDTRYAVSSKPGGCLDERPDSPPAGRKKPSLFHKTFALCANVLWNKEKTYHAAAGESSVHLGTCPALCTHRV